MVCMHLLLRSAMHRTETTGLTTFSLQIFYLEDGASPPPPPPARLWGLHSSCALQALVLDWGKEGSKTGSPTVDPWLNQDLQGGGNSNGLYCCMHAKGLCSAGLIAAWYAVCLLVAISASAPHSYWMLLLLVACLLEGHATAQHLICKGFFPRCETFPTLHVCVYGCSLRDGDLQLVLAINPSPHRLSTEFVPWNFYRPYPVTSKFAVRMLSATCEPTKPTYQNPATPCCSHIVSCKFHSLPTWSMRHVTIALTAYSHGSRAMALRLEPKRFRGTYQHCIGAPLFNVRQQLPYLRQVRNRWQANGVQWSYIFARTRHGCEAASAVYPEAHCSVRSRHFSNATTPKYDQAILQQLCLIYARHAKARFLVLTDVDELPPPNFNTFLDEQWPRVARNRSTGGFRIFFDAAKSCPPDFRCPRSLDHYQAACPTNLTRLAYKPVVVPARVQFVHIHWYFTATGRWPRDDIVWDPCLEHLRASKCRLRDDNSTECEPD